MTTQHDLDTPVWRPHWGAIAVLSVAGLIMWAGLVKIAEIVWSLI